MMADVLSSSPGAAKDVVPKNAIGMMTKKATIRFTPP